MERNPYDVLGVPEDASEDTIKAVYRQLARTFHPDVNADPQAVEHFREITDAFVLLTDPVRRRAWKPVQPHRRSDREEETETYVGLNVAGIDLGGVLGVSIVTRRRTLLPDPPPVRPEPPRAAAALPGRRRRRR